MARYVCARCPLLLFTIRLILFNTQMQRDVKEVTDAFLKASRGDDTVAAQIMSNFQSQRVVAPFLYHEVKSPLEKFGSNTIMGIKSTTDGSYCADVGKARHCLITAGATGPLSKNEVREHGCVTCECKHTQ